MFVCCLTWANAGAKIHVCVRTIWTDVKVLLVFFLVFPLICRGCRGGMMGLAVTKTLIRCLWYRWGRSSTYMRASFHFRQWQPAKPWTGMSTVWWFYFLYGFRNLNIFIQGLWHDLCSQPSVRTSMRISSETLSNLFKWKSCLLHVRYIPLHNSQRPFWASVLLMSARQDDMSPSGNTCLANNLNSWLDLWIYTF